MLIVVLLQQLMLKLAFYIGGFCKMIKCHLSKLMGERRLKVIELARVLEIHRNPIDLLYNETATRVDLNLVSKLCKYFDCKVEDLLEYIEDD